MDDGDYDPYRYSLTAGVLRLAQALARLRLADEVQQPDVDEALRLMECSKDSLQDENEDAQEHDRSVASQIYRLIRGMLSRKTKPLPKRFGKGPGRERDMDVDSDEEEGDDTLSMVDVRARVLNAGWTEAQLMDCITGVSSLHSRAPDFPLIIVMRSMKTSKSGPVLLMARSCRSWAVTNLGTHSSREISFHLFLCLVCTVSYCRLVCVVISSCLLAIMKCNDMNQLPECLGEPRQSNRGNTVTPGNRSVQ